MSAGQASEELEPGQPDNAVAIIGLSGRFPGAGTIEQFWHNLCAGVESVTHFRDAELEDSFSDEVRRAPNYVKARPILPDVEQFDADFFGMYARESELTDPQQRIFLECAWEALESAGYDPAAYRGLIGVFAGCSINTYFLQHVCADRRTIEEFASSYQVGCYPQLLGAGLDFLATRVSYKLDLKGPSVTLQSACSTSLLAVAQACQSLLLYQADMALAGGASITFPQKRGYLHQEGGMVSADGRCRPFDAQATGTIFGSGAGAVLLKRLEDALADGDHIYAVIRGCGVNNDGATKVGFTAPSASGQAAAIEMAHSSAGIDPRSISYVECHGTATPLGDPIEVAGLTQAFRAGTDERQFCALGSVKSNIGHLDAAAGVAGLIKTALSLHHGVLPPSLHFTQPNPQIDFAATPFFVNSRLTEWPATTSPRRAGVSAFGVGGTNVHLVLEEAPGTTPAREAPAAASQLIVLSARTETALACARANLAAHLRQHPGLVLSDVAFTLQAGRRAFDKRCFVVGKSSEEVVKKLEDPAAFGKAGSRRGRPAAVAFMFPGQGAQHLNMARDLYDGEPEFRRHVDRCVELCTPLIGADLTALLYPATDSPAAAERLTATMIAQPAIFTVEYALAQLWMSWGIRPAAMIGHSVGEFVAAVIAGVLSLEDALSLVVMRGRLMQTLPAGSMLAVRLPEREVRPLLTAQLSIAAVNGPSLCVASGPHEAIQSLEQILQARAVVSRRLHTSHAFHSAMVDPVVNPLRERLTRITLSAPAIPYVSCVTGTWIRDEEATSPDYWARHARETVRFADGIASLVSRDPAPLLLEVGPGNVLSTLSLQTLQGKEVAVVTSLQDAARESNDRDCMLEALGNLWVHGAEPDWRAIHAAQPRRVPLPTYPFERKRHWIEPPARESLTPQSPDNRQHPASPPATAPSMPDMTAPIATSQDAQPMSDQPVQSRVPELCATIAGMLEELSGNKHAATETATFLEMGYDSLFLTQVAQKIQSQLKVKITFRQLLASYPTIPALASFLAEKLPTSAGPGKAVAALGAPIPVTVTTLTALPPTAEASRAATELQVQATPSAAIEGIFREQLQAMTQLVNRQMELLQGLRPSALGNAAGGSGALFTTLPASVTVGTGALSAARQTPQRTGSAPASAELGAAATPQQPPSRFEVYKTKRDEAAKTLTPEHQRHLDSLIARYTQRTAGSKRFTQSHRAVLADPRAAAGFRTEWKELVYPIVCARSSGSKLWDVDGNEYIDLVNGYGQTAFGHSPDFVVDAVKAQLEQGFPIGPQAQLAGKVAALFAEITGNERVTFCNTGSEAVMAAMRVARTVTGRSKVVIFNGDYHGQFDEVLVKGVQRPGAEPRSVPVAPGIPASAVENMIVLEYATPATLQWVRDNAADLAAVIVEPVQSRHPSLQPFDFLREIRQITEAAGVAFVMDEVVTGFRVHPGGIQAVTGIRADMVTYGKVVGGGMPIGILAGKAQFMDALDGGQWSYGDDSFPEVGVTFFAGTFVRHPLALAAAWAVLQHVKAQGPALQERLTQRTGALASTLNQLFAQYQLSARIETFSSWFYFHLHGEHPLAALLFYHLRLRGIHIQDGFPCFLTTAHSEADIQRIVEAFRDSLSELQSVGIVAPGATESAGQGTESSGIPLTESQTEIWLSAQMGDEASCAFNESVTLHLRGSLNRDALQQALSGVVARHDALRLRFSVTGEEMRVSAAVPMELPVTDHSDRPAAEAERGLQELLAKDARTPFDLVHGPVVRALLVRLAPDYHALVISSHHIVCDGWSFNVIVSELAAFYQAACRGATPGLEPALTFGSYARSQKQRDPAEAARTEAFWLQQFAEPVKPLELPTDRPRAALKSYRGTSRSRRIGASLYQQVKKAGAKSGNTLFVTLLGAFQALIGRLCEQQEVVVGVPTAGQSLLEDQILVGHCVNFLPIRTRWSHDTSLAQHLSAVARKVLDAYEHQSYTLGTLVRRLALPREQNRVPLAEIQFNLERLADHLTLPGLAVEVTPNPKAAVNFDLFLNVIESNEGLRLDCDYNTDLFDESTIDRWLDAYQVLLQAIVADPSQALSRVAYLPDSDRQRLLVDFNRTALAFSQERCVHQLFEAQVAERPQAIAAQFGNETLTYEALDRRANQLANLLLQRIGRASDERLVGVCVERSLEMLIAVLAVMKAGCAYVPLDPAHPAARLQHILTDADVTALITDGISSNAVPATAAVIHLRNDAAAIAAAATSAPKSSVAADRLCYVIYTSGSTGVPKGVEITHRAVVNFLTSMAREPGLTQHDTVFAVTTVSFDIAGLELYLPLSVGARVVIADREEMADGFALLQHLQGVGATLMQATPATWRLLLEAGFRAKPGFRMLCGGEALPRELANRLAQGDGELWNMYGPTETTIWSSCSRVAAGDDPITVGRPIANTRFYVLDHNDQPVMLGVSGQLYIGGEGVARGYHKRPELTAQKFWGSPFEPGRLYRTGDVARWLPDGQLQLLGRADDQIKLRGFRIELGEIESVLMTQGGLQATAVILREDVPGSPRLAAYYVESAGMTVSAAALRERLAERLPDYMVPSLWVRLEALPLTPNGKLDRNALPRPDDSRALAQEFVAPATGMESTLAKIWAEVLRVERIGANDDLLQLGADSIQLFQITARANRIGVKLTTKQLLQHRTVAALAAFANESGLGEGLDSRPDPSSLAQFKRNRRRGGAPER